MQNQAQLNQQFAIKDQLQFSHDSNGFVMIEITNQYAAAKISTYAGQLVSYQPHCETEDLLFLSDKAVYQQGKAIRGGIPLCWPWFGDDTSGFERPAHGFVRNQQWNVVATEALDDGRTSVILSTTDTEQTREFWHYAFILEIEIIIGSSLEVKLTTKNTDKHFFTITQALHTYFNISDVDNVLIEGLDGNPYIDKLDSFATKQQQGDISVSDEIDRIYQKAPKYVTIKDSGFDRTITIGSYGCDTTIVWNPWSTSTSKIADLDKESYRKFVCVETANVFTDSLTIIPAGREHVVRAVFTIS
jgi:glucose-6-phosphate 1-epimerase